MICLFLTQITRLWDTGDYRYPMTPKPQDSLLPPLCSTCIPAAPFEHRVCILSSPFSPGTVLIGRAGSQRECQAKRKSVQGNKRGNQLHTYHFEYSSISQISTKVKKKFFKDNPLENWRITQIVSWMGTSCEAGFWSHLTLYLIRASASQKSITMRSTIYRIFPV